MTRKVFLASSLVLVFFLIYASAAAQDLDPGNDTAHLGREFASSQLLVRFRPSVSAQRADQILAQRGLSRMQRIGALDVHVLRLPPGLSVEGAVSVFSRLPEVEFAEPNYILRALAPTEQESEIEEIYDQWGLEKIQAPDAWGEFTAKPPVLIAIVDTGIYSAHPDLRSNIWQNLNEVPDNGIDDDENGYVDDTWGWDFFNNDNNPYDDNKHGTAVSSVAAGVQDGSGVAGVCPWCQLIAVKVLGAKGSATLAVVANGVVYAADNGAEVINLSLGAPYADSPTLSSAIDHAWSQGALVIAAAGNNGNDAPFYPAAYDNAIAVASTNEQDYHSCFSNYGDFVSVSAPGEAILCAIPPDAEHPEGGYGTYNGTSLSAPHVSGLGGLLLSQDPSRTNAEVRALIETTASDLGPVGPDAFFGTGRINAYRAATGDSSPVVPAAGLFTDDLTASGYAHARKLARDADGTLHLVWHGQEGGQYRVLYASSDDDGATWSGPQEVFTSSAETFHPALALDGANVYVVFPSLHDSTDYYRVFFAYKPLSGEGWSSPIAVMGGTHHALRPDLYLDPSNGRLHLVASSQLEVLGSAPYVYYTFSADQGATWSTIRQVNVGQGTRYADVHALGDSVYIATRTLGLIWYRVYTIRSLDGGDTWDDLTQLADHLALFTAEYGASLAGVGDRLYLAYEHSGTIYFRSSDDGVNWSTPEDLGFGKWPSLTQADDGQAWLMSSDSDGATVMRHYTGDTWASAETIYENSCDYPNLKLGISGDRVEWVATHCSGAPFRLMYDSRAIGANSPPVADDRTVMTSEDTPVGIALTGSDPDGDPLTYSVVTDPIHGSLNDTAPNLTYTPDPDFSGSDGFTFKVNDGIIDSTPATVSITVAPANDLPVANDDIVSTLEDNSVSVNVAANDTDVDGNLNASSAAVVSGPSNGTVINNGDGAFTYTPNTDFNGTDSFVYEICDTDGLCDQATVAITIDSVNDPPTANDDSGTTPEDIPITMDVATNDTDPDGNLDSSSATMVSGPSNGTVINNGDGTITYAPNADFNGIDSFVYEICDANGACDTATVTITITPVNDLPVAAFTYYCAFVASDFDASSSYDPDGTVVSYD